MEDLKYSPEQELKNFNSEIAQHQKKIKIKVITSSTGIVVLLISMIFKNTGLYHINQKTLLFIVSLLLLLILIGVSYMFFLLKAKTLEYPRKKKDLQDVYKVYKVIYMIVNTVVLLLVFQMYFISTGLVTQTSMEPTLYENDRIIINHFSVQYERFDLVVFDIDGNEDYHVKRIVGLPGETISIIEGNLYINGLLQTDFYNSSSDGMTYCSVEGLIDVNETCSWTLDEDEYFVLGDNRGVSVDSRRFGPIDKLDLYGEVIVSFDGN